MTDSDPSGPEPKHHHTLRERLEAAEAAADETLAEDAEASPAGGFVESLAVPLHEAEEAIRAALHPERISEPHEPGPPEQAHEDHHAGEEG